MQEALSPAGVLGPEPLSLMPQRVPSEPAKRCFQTMAANPFFRQPEACRRFQNGQGRNTTFQHASGFRPQLSCLASSRSRNSTGGEFLPSRFWACSLTACRMKREKSYGASTWIGSLDAGLKNRKRRGRAVRYPQGFPTAGFFGSL